MTKLFLFMLFCTVAAGSGLAQERKGAGEKVRIRKLNALGTKSKVSTPQYKSSEPRATGRAKKWHQVSVLYDSSPEWIDELTIQFHVLAVTREPKTKKKAFSLYKLVVKYSDIEQGRGHTATAFLRPSASKRFGDPIAVATVFSVDGRVVGEISQESEKLPEKWWKNPRVTDSNDVTVRQGYLLSRSKTPWALINYDDYEAIK
jgi:hypothetical protein